MGFSFKCRKIYGLLLPPTRQTESRIRLNQRRPNIDGDLPVNRSHLFDRSRPLFGIYQNLFAASVQSIALRLTVFFGSPYLYEEAFSQMKTIKSIYGSLLSHEPLKYCLHLCQVILIPISVSHHKICSAIRHLRNRKINDKHLVIMVKCSSLKRSIFDK
jgi:hypothetical protein